MGVAIVITVNVKFLLDNKKSEEVVAIESGQTLSDLLRKLGVSDKDYYIFIVNGSNRFEDYILQDGDIVQLFPQMSGG